MSQPLTLDGVMDKIAGMRKLGAERQITYKSVPEIVAGLDFVAAGMARTERFDGRKLRTGHVANALVLWLLELPDDQLHAVLPPMLRRLEQYLRGEDAVPAREGAKAPASPRGAPEPAPAPKRDAAAAPRSAQGRPAEMPGGRKRRA